MFCSIEFNAEYMKRSIPHGALIRDAVVTAIRCGQSVISRSCRSHVVRHDLCLSQQRIGHKRALAYAGDNYCGQSAWKTLGNGCQNDCRRNGWVKSVHYFTWGGTVSLVQILPVEGVDSIAWRCWASLIEILSIPSIKTFARRSWIPLV